MIGPGDKYTRKSRLADMLRNTPNLNNGSHMGGLAHALTQGLAGWQMGEDRRDAAEANRAFIQGLSGPGGGLNNAVTALQGMPDNEHAQGRLQGLLIEQANRKYGESQEEARRRAKLDDYKTQKGIDENFSPRRIIKGVDGKNYYEDSAEAVLPGVVAAPDKPVPGRDVPLAPDVFNQKVQIAGAQADAKADADRRAIAGTPLPPAALKEQNEMLDTLGTAKGIQADLRSLSGMIDSGQLDLGLFGNGVNTLKNFVGMSDEQSRNYGSFKNTIEKLRNDSLRLNKGMQTEGDAQRALKELFDNINDPKLVKQRLQELDTINQRAVDLKNYQMSVLRQNFGKGPLENMPTVQGAPGSGQISSIANDADYDALPSGTMFKGPDGIVRRKP